MAKAMLIVSCSKRKRSLPAGQAMIAGELYDGVAFRTIRAWRNRHPLIPLTILIVSARHALVTWDTLLEPYDLRMTTDTAMRLRPEVERMLSSFCVDDLGNVYVELGRDYLSALPDVRRLFPRATITFGQGRIGERMRNLRTWLESLARQRKRLDKCL